MANIAEVIHVRMIDEENMHAPYRRDPRVRGANGNRRGRTIEGSYRAPGRDEHSDSSGVFKKYRPVATTEFSSDCA